MHTVRKLKPGEEYRRIKISETMALVSMARGGEFAVVDENALVVFVETGDGKKRAEIFQRKSTALREADYLNRKRETKMKTCPICGEEFEGNGDFCDDCALSDYEGVRDSDYGYSRGSGLFE